MLDALLQNPLIALFGIIGLGMALGKVKVAGLSLGSSGVLFVALAAGHFGYTLYPGVGSVGLVLFVYCVGIGAGGRFFAAISRHGSTLAQLALAVVGLGAALAVLFAWWLDIPKELAAGIFAGALTSTPALAAATDYLTEAGGQVSIGYGIAYPFGVIGVVLFVQLLPRLLKIDLNREAILHDKSEPQEDRVSSVLVQVTNPEVFGQNIAGFDPVMSLSCQITRVRRGDRMDLLSYDDVFNEGMEVLVIGMASKLSLAERLLGHRSENPFVLDVDRERRQLILTNNEFSGKKIRDLHLLRNYRVIISRVTRLGITFVPSADTVLDNMDVLTAVGSPEHLEVFAEKIGHRSQAFDETDLLSLGVGITLGVVAGLLSLQLPGGGVLSLGLAGGPLFIGLILGHFGRVGWIVGHIPRPTRILLQELGLVLFLADAGVRGGGQMVETLQVYGMSLFGMGMIITMVPLLFGYFLARRIFRMNVLQSLGGICGGMTSTPALGAITAKTESQAPVVSYAAAYPVALILMTVFAKLMLEAIVWLAQ
jgi:putative transport protein